MLIYRAGLGSVADDGPAHARPRRRRRPRTVEKPLFGAAELDRYARHIVLREIGGPGQKALKEARVLVIGAGGLGSPAILYLAAAGVGTIGVIDGDDVENSNLQRQVIHDDAISACPRCNRPCNGSRRRTRMSCCAPIAASDAEIAADLFADYDLILDGTDNFDTRYLANATAAAQGKPLISGALSQWEGQLSVFDPARGTPCYQCIFPDAPRRGWRRPAPRPGCWGRCPAWSGR